MKPNKSNSLLISVVLPAHNESEGLADTIGRLTRQLYNSRYEIIIVDDGSTDGTWDIISGLSRSVVGVRGLRFSRNFGHQPALLAGLSCASGDAVIMMDSDGQHPPELIPEMIAKWRAGASVVQTLRSDGGAGTMKRSSSKGFYKLFNWLAGTNIPSGSADFRLLDRGAVDLVLAHPKSALFLRGFIPWTGLSTEYIEFEPGKRTAGVTKYSSKRMFGLARQGVMRFSVKPLRLATMLGGLTCLGVLIYLVYVLAVRLLGLDEFVSGWASLASLLILLGGIQLIVIGILGEYIGMIFETQLGRPPYIVEERTEESTQKNTTDNPAADKNCGIN
jgi:glycosyltransferase involved in cell wall biosynthesis